MCECELVLVNHKHFISTYFKKSEYCHCITSKWWEGLWEMVQAEQYGEYMNICYFGKWNLQPRCRGDAFLRTGRQHFMSSLNLVILFLNGDLHQVSELSSEVLVSSWVSWYGLPSEAKGNVKWLVVQSDVCKWCKDVVAFQCYLCFEVIKMLLKMGFKPVRNVKSSYLAVSVLVLIKRCHLDSSNIDTWQSHPSVFPLRPVTTSGWASPLGFSPNYYSGTQALCPSVIIIIIII